MTAAPAHPRRLVLLGHPVSQSLSPRFQTAALDHARATQHGMPTRYEAIDVVAEALPALLRSLVAERAAGNVTVPHKERVASLASRLTPMAARVGAVNTFWSEDGSLIGHNTDVAGVTASLHALGVYVSGACAVLGAGGSAAAVLVALEALGARDVRMWARSPERLHALSRRVGVPVTAYDTAAGAVDGASLVVNATPIGMRDDDVPVSPAALARGARVLDLVYRPGETAFVRACRAEGIVAHDGLRMLVEQGAAAFRCWFGIEPSRDAMWRVLEARP